MHRFLLLLPLCLASCAYTSAERVAYNSDEKGFRIYDPMTLMVVTCSNVEFVSVPDFTRGYTVTFGAVMAKNDSSLKVTDGMMTDVSAKLDDTAFLAMLQALGEKAISSAKDLAALGAEVSGTIPGMQGVWRLFYDSDGNFETVKRIQLGAPCPKGDAAPPAGNQPAKGPKAPVDIR